MRRNRQRTCVETISTCEIDITGKGHNDRAPCSIAAVNEKGDTILSLVVKCADIYSPLTQITGLTREDIAAGVRAGVFAGHDPIANEPAGAF